MKIKLIDHPTLNREWDKKKIQEKTKKILKRIGELQYKMYAENKRSLLIVLQGTDASGKTVSPLVSLNTAIRFALAPTASKNPLRKSMLTISSGGCINRSREKGRQWYSSDLIMKISSSRQSKKFSLPK